VLNLSDENGADGVRFVFKGIFGCTPLAVLGRPSREEIRLPRNAWSGAPLRLSAPRANWDFRVIDPRTFPAQHLAAC
jgi:hypothetical protein